MKDRREQKERRNKTMNVKQMPLTTKVTCLFFIFFSIPVLQLGLVNLSMWIQEGMAGTVILAYAVFLWLSVMALLESKRWAWHLVICGNAVGLTVIRVFCPVEAILFGVPVIVLALTDLLLWVREKRT
ncbi:hypothetical protein J7L49_00620 [Candidatus Bathyarchaeota archaeon]|nr:hypothetical protein [Candidatus Bathyarchaeota archaeon]